MWIFGNNRIILIVHKNRSCRPPHSNFIEHLQLPFLCRTDKDYQSVIYNKIPTFAVLHKTRSCVPLLGNVNKHPQLLFLHRTNPDYRQIIYNQIPTFAVLPHKNRSCGPLLSEVNQMSTRNSHFYAEQTKIILGLSTNTNLRSSSMHV